MPYDWHHQLVFSWVTKSFYSFFSYLLTDRHWDPQIGLLVCTSGSDHGLCVLLYIQSTLYIHCLYEHLVFASSKGGQEWPPGMLELIWDKCQHTFMSAYAFRPTWICSPEFCDDEDAPDVCAPVRCRVHQSEQFTERWRERYLTTESPSMEIMRSNKCRRCHLQQYHANTSQSTV